MEIGTLQIMQSFGYDGISDAQVYDEETRLGMLADELGYDHVWCVEHHFEDYSFCPDNFVYLANLAAKTKRIKLATGAVIVPWNIQPLRVAEKAALLDELCDGRLILGLGRGLSRREFNQFGISMNESRERYDEAAPMILDALQTGVMAAHDGQFYQQPEAPLRPRPRRSFKDRTVQVAMSPDSAEMAAKLGVAMMAFNYKPLEQQKAECEDYARMFQQNHGYAPQAPYLTDMMICDSDAARARENAEKYIAGYCLSVLHHYEMMGEHYKEVKGYKAYGDAVDMLREAGQEGMAKAYVEQQIWGTPEQMLRKFEQRWAAFGPSHTLCAFRFAGAPFEVAERSITLFAKEVLPILQKWSAESPPKVASAAA